MGVASLKSLDTPHVFHEPRVFRIPKISQESDITVIHQIWRGKTNETSGPVSDNPLSFHTEGYCRTSRHCWAIYFIHGNQSRTILWNRQHSSLRPTKVERQVVSAEDPGALVVRTMADARLTSIPAENIGSGVSFEL